jgi:hypothetical protein
MSSKMMSTGDIEEARFELADVEKGVSHMPDIYKTPCFKRSLTLPQAPQKEYATSSRIMNVVVSGRRVIRTLKF